ncbi:hypothetical protein [Paractinoplanes maris]|uniref:hypothetical protein n=1 Tax=Paractinoplanes maris TaxID=1734446 RepID=UPI00201FD68F|nr:hypothetical protein [Actinoplanes maris]
MNSRLSRPLLAAVVSGAFLAGGGLFAAPAFAEPTPTATESGTPTAEPTTPAPDPTTTKPTPPPPGDPTAPPTTLPPPTETTTPATTPPATTPPVTTPPVTTPPATTTPPPPADKTAPSGTFAPNRWSIFPGQSVTLTLTGIKDNVSTPAQIKRVVTWGDGASSTVSTSATSIAHTYKSSGKKPITLTLTDAAGNKRVVKSVGPTVVPSSVKYKLSRTSVFHGQKFVWELLSVPAGATKITVAWGDGRATVISKPKKQKITRYYYATPNNMLVPTGTKTLKATAYNKYGAATPQVVGKVTLKPDTARPTVKIIPPSNAGKASSWKAIKGTVGDTGSGVKELIVIAVVAKPNGTEACWSSAKKKWVTVTASTNINVCLNAAKPSGGKFSLAVKSTPKGGLAISGIAADWAGNLNADSNGNYSRYIN